MQERNEEKLRSQKSREESKIQLLNGIGRFKFKKEGTFLIFKKHAR